MSGPTRVNCAIYSPMSNAAPYIGGGEAQFLFQQVWAWGTSTGQMNKRYLGSRSLGTGANEDIDLKDLTDESGAAINIVELRLFCIHNPSSNDGTLEVKPSASNGHLGFLKDATDVLIIHPGGIAIIAIPLDGAAAVGATTDNVNIKNNGGGTVVYGLLVGGVDA